MELSYKVFNFTEDQDLKLKVGYNAFKQVSVVTCNVSYISVLMSRSILLT